MSSIMRARNRLMGRGEVSEVIGALSRAEGCCTFNARDRMPRPSRTTAHYLAENAPTATRGPSRASGFVLRRYLGVRMRSSEGQESTRKLPFEASVTFGCNAILGRAGIRGFALLSPGIGRSEVQRDGVKSRLRFEPATGLRGRRYR